MINHDKLSENLTSNRNDPIYILGRYYLHLAKETGDDEFYDEILCDIIEAAFEQGKSRAIDVLQEVNMEMVSEKQNFIIQDLFKKIDHHTATCGKREIAKDISKDDS